ncbi:hypothetical protein R1sor_022210 [Riccia sorocarpa]|uniref:Uncharacterized protein n=1 Tax=Riccia sorocarpa TaxID=122646 RepID=A0ABD3GNG3_9MARC
MVELWGDSRGKNAMISGGEAGAWKALSQKAGLVDAYIYAVDRKGGMDVLEEELISDLTQKYEKKLNHWSSKLLSWPERIVLANTVLRALPNYMLMALGMSTHWMHMVERITLEFLWGKNMTERNRKLLIAWATLTNKKKQGGLGWSSMEETANVFLLKNITQICDYQHQNWINLAHAIIHHQLQTSTKTKKIKSWKPQQVLLGLKNFRTPLSLTLNRMLITWYIAKRRLTWRPNEGPHSEDATPTFVCSILTSTQTVEESETQGLRNLFRKARIKNTADLRNANGERLSLQSYCQQGNIPIDVDLDPVLDKLETLLPAEDAAQIQWQEAKGWKCETIKHTVEKTWKLSTKQWRNLIQIKIDDSKELNRKWERVDTLQQCKIGGRSMEGSGDQHDKAQILGVHAERILYKR